MHKEIINPVSRYSNGDRYEEDTQLELGEDPVPESIRKREANNPWAACVADRMRYPGDHPVAIISNGQNMVMVFKLADREMGVLFGDLRKGYPYKWTHYERISDLDFKAAIETVESQIAETREMEIPKEGAA